jgi:hypothetical protein
VNVAAAAVYTVYAFCCRFAGFSRRNDVKHVVFMGAIDDGPTMAGVRSSGKQPSEAA